MKLSDLKGQRPAGHPLLRRGPHGKPLLEKEQVWAEVGTHLLWVVVSLKPRSHSGAYHHHVWLRLYGAGSKRFPHREISEQTLRAGMCVWEDTLPQRPDDPANTDDEMPPPFPPAA
ncbi:MAG TPA: hypothetical protein VMV50_02715 [Candidatus Paceibacterota bacterium]|nr:hypothetical protein [Candidatus Paceibacterota bacterium]